ncbi:hypothetical protein RRG08_039685 [Elysia crispata]|uniref:Uncharacterized protein n=1 Tax=Elysia crispata TaxID=231223 RepID=A0AAE0YBL7_9GAST|nr:hypothetical protein RRG08_039685 [Elysia crispata]
MSWTYGFSFIQIKRDSGSNFGVNELGKVGRLCPVWYWFGPKRLRIVAPQDHLRSTLQQEDTHSRGQQTDQGRHQK